MPANPTDIESLTDHVRGEIFRPGDAGYDDARAVWNGLIDREPAVIVRCRGTADVIETVELARNSEMPLAIRGGGHGMTGHAVCDDGIVIDLSAMDAVRVNPTDRTVRVQGGASWDQVNHEALLPYGTGGEYINNQTEDDEERVRAAYGDHYERLQAVKNEWDPENLFRVNHNIEPTV